MLSPPSEAELPYPHLVLTYHPLLGNDKLESWLFHDAANY